MMTRNDVKLLVVLLSLTLLSWVGVRIFLASSPGSVVVVNARGVDVNRIPLSKSGTYEVEGLLGRSIFEIDHGRVRMVSSACPDKLCIGMGWVSKPGQVIVCIPNRVVLKVEKR